MGSEANLTEVISGSSQSKRRSMRLRSESERCRVSQFAMENSTTSSRSAGEEAMLVAARLIDTYVPSVLCPFGILGNGLAFWVMSTKQFRGTNNAIYIRALALSDLTYVVVQCIQKPIMAALQHDYFNSSSPETGWFYYACKQRNFVYWTSQQLSRNLMVALTIDRAVVVALPLKSRNFCTVGTAKFGVSLSIFLAVLERSVALVMTYQPALLGIWLCPYYFTGQVAVILESIFITETFVNMILLSLPTGVIIIALVLGTRRRTQLGNSHDKSKSNNKITMMLLVTAIMLLISMLGLVGFYFLDWESSSVKENYALTVLLSDIQRTYEVVNYVANFYVYITFNVRIRRLVVTTIGNKICVKTNSEAKANSVPRVCEN